MPYLHVILDSANTNTGALIKLNQPVVTNVLHLQHAVFHSDVIPTYSERNLYIDLGFAKKKVSMIKPDSLHSGGRLVIPIDIGVKTTQVNLGLDIGTARARIPETFKATVYKDAGGTLPYTIPTGTNWELHLYFEFVQESLF